MAIVRAIDAGETEQAFVLLARSYRVCAYQVAVRILRDPALAEDAVQEALLQVRHGLPRWERRASVRTWVLRIVVHRALDEIRRRRRRRYSLTAVPPEAVDDRPTPVEAVAAGDAHALVEQSLRVLKPEARTAVLLRFREELSYEEIGKILGEQPDTVRLRIVRAMPRLRRRLAQLGVGGYRAVG